MGNKVPLQTAGARWQLWQDHQVVLRGNAKNRRTELLWRTWYVCYWGGNNWLVLLADSCSGCASAVGAATTEGLTGLTMLLYVSSAVETVQVECYLDFAVLLQGSCTGLA